MRKFLIILTFILGLTPLFSLSAQTTEMEEAYNALAARFDGRDKALQNDLKEYLLAFPYTTYVDEVKFM